MGFAGESGVFVGALGAGDSERSGEGSVVRLIILWILSLVRELVGGVRSCGFWDETAEGLPDELKMTEAKQDMRAGNRVRYLLAEILSARGVVRASRSVAEVRWLQ